jgi:translation initiation factor 2B subunit (eIF-2B alpha/beta/delta family)
MVQSLRQRISEELQGGLDLVKDVLALYTRCILLSPRIITGPEPSDELRIHRTQALHLLSTSRSPNAGQVIDSLLQGLEEILRGTPNQVSLNQEIRSKLRSYDLIRSHHAQVANLKDDFLNVLDDRTTDETEQVRIMQQIISRYKERKKEAYRTIMTKAPALLAGHKAIFLYGYSNAVLAALDSLPSKDAGIRVFECRPKSNHSADGKLVYCDGTEYAKRINKLGYKNIEVWPDGSACGTIRQAASEKLNPVVLLGAEGIDADTGDVLSTIGTMPVALSAKHNSAKIYVFAEGGKVRPGLRESVNNRQNSWLTSDDKMRDVVGEADITVRNLLTERVSADLVDLIISERGAKPPRDMVKPPAERKRQHTKVASHA